ncbi:hypothetical protein D3C84_703980 [compost metagenome]
MYARTGQQRGVRAQLTVFVEPCVGAPLGCAIDLEGHLPLSLFETRRQPEVLRELWIDPPRLENLGIKNDALISHNLAQRSHHETDGTHNPYSRGSPCARARHYLATKGAS